MRLKAMAEKLNACIALVKEAQNNDMHDLCARHLYEMVGDIIMSHLLLINVQKAPELFAKSLSVYINHAEAEVEKHNKWISRINVAELDNYRQA